MPPYVRTLSVFRCAVIPVFRFYSLPLQHKKSSPSAAFFYRRPWRLWLFLNSALRKSPFRKSPLRNSSLRNASLLKASCLSNSLNLASLRRSIILPHLSQRTILCSILNCLALHAPHFLTSRALTFITNMAPTANTNHLFAFIALPSILTDLTLFFFFFLFYLFSLK